MRKRLILVFSVAFLIRLIALNQSLWLDEAITANVVKNFGFLEIITRFSPTDFHPPLYYLLMKSWSMVFGYSEIVLRFPSIIFSLLTGWLVFLIGKKLKNEEAGFWAAIFFLFNPLIVYYSQEARMYMMATCLLTVSLYYYLVNGLTRSRINGLLFNIFISLSFLTFYGSIFLIIPIFFYLLYKKRYKYFLFSSSFFILSFLLISPLLYQQLLNSKEALKMVINWNNVLGGANLKNLLLIPLKSSFGRISFYPKNIYYAISGLWTIFVWYFVFRGGKKNPFFFYLIIGSLTIGLLVSFISPLLQYFRFLYLIPIVSLLLETGLTDMRSPVKKTPSLLFLFGFVVLSLFYLLNPGFHREDWKGLAKSLPENATVYIILPSSDPLKYYRDDLILKDLTLLRQGYEGQGKEITVIPYTTDIYGFEYKGTLTKQGFKLRTTSVSRGLTLERWVKIEKNL